MSKRLAKRSPSKRRAKTEPAGKGQTRPAARRRAPQTFAHAPWEQDDAPTQRDLFGEARAKSRAGGPYGPVPKCEPDEPAYVDGVRGSGLCPREPSLEEQRRELRGPFRPLPSAADAAVDRALSDPRVQSILANVAQATGDLAAITTLLRSILTSFFPKSQSLNPKQPQAFP